jgi:Skp family chaperone for outer membrane proteins
MSDGGKGAAPRPIPDWDKYSDNWDRLFKKQPQTLKDIIEETQMNDMIAELERENMMMRARNERLEKEVKWLETALNNAQHQLLNLQNQQSQQGSH